MSTAFLGAVAGSVAAFVGVAMSAGLVIDDAAGFTLVDATSGRGTITAGTDAMYLYVLGSGLVGGAIIAYLTVTISRLWRPAEPRFGPGLVAVAGAVIGAVAAYLSLRVGIGLGGQIENEVITISAFRAVVTFLAAGAVAGSTVAITADRLSQPAALGLAGDAWPRTAAAFRSETMPAMLIPTLAIVVVAAIVFGVSQVLIAGGTVGSIVVASLVAVVVLAGAAYLVYAKPPDEAASD